MVVLEWTEYALEDLKNIHEYISKDSVFYANRFIDKLINRTSQLEKFPNSGRVVPQFDTGSLRELIEGN